jgi:hypothetical protein
MNSEENQFKPPANSGLLSRDLSTCHLEILRLRDEVIGLQAELVEARNRIERSLDEDQELRTYSAAGLISYLEAQGEAQAREIALIRNSWTWKIGRIVMTPIRVLKTALGRA